MENTLYYKYFFIFEDGKKENFEIYLDRETLKLQHFKAPEPSAWTKLEHHKCRNCPLSKEEYPECPLALNLRPVIERFSGMFSFEKAHVIVETAERNYSQNTQLQSGLSAMLGIFMVTSDCPVMAPLRPMVRFHLPFASIEETVFRSASSYLLGQYFKLKAGKEPDWDMSNLTDIYNSIQVVNQGMAARMRSAVDKDANLNALVVLDVFAKELPFSIEKRLQDLEYLFRDIDIYE